MSDQSDQRFFGRVGLHSKGIPYLRLETFLREVDVDLAQDFIEITAIVVFTDPQFEARQGGVVGSGFKDAIANEPLDQEVVANLKFELAR